MKRISILAAFLAVFLSLSITAGADINEYVATQPYPLATQTTLASSPPQMRSGTPPVGYEGADGGYTTVKSDRGLPTTEAPFPSVQIDEFSSTATSASITALVDRVWVIIQNRHATESAFVYPGETATPGFGIEVLAGSSIARQWDDTVTVSIVSTNTVPLLVEQDGR